MDSKVQSLRLLAVATVVFWCLSGFGEDWSFTLTGRRTKSTSRLPRAATYQVTVETPYGTSTFDCPDDVYVLDQAQQEGLALPYSCRAGACSKCTGKVVVGSIDQSDQSYLDADQVDAGYCLTCVSKPTSDVTIRTHCEEEATMVLDNSLYTVAPAPIEQHVGSAAAAHVKCRQNFAAQSELLLNQQVQMELAASHSYLSMGAYFDRADVALPGFKAWAMKQSKEESEHAEKFIKYVNLRGGQYVPSPIPQPVVYEWSSALEAMQHALKMEMAVNRALLKLHQTASDLADPQLCDFLETNYLEEQVESINQIAQIARKLTRAGPGLGEYSVDKEMAD